MACARGGGEELGRAFFQGVVGTFLVKSASTGLSLLIGVLLARLLRAERYGVYAFAMAWVGLLGVPAVLGMDKLLVREVAAFRTCSEWGLMAGIVRRAFQSTLIASASLALLASFVVVLVNRPLSLMGVACLVAMILLPVAAATRLIQAIMQGLGRVVAGQLPELLARPLFFVVLLAVFHFVRRSELGPSRVIALNVVAAAIGLIIGLTLLSRAFPLAARRISPRYQTRRWLGNALPLLFIGGMQLINSQTDTIMLGAIVGSEASGVYVVASRVAGLIAFVLMAVNASLAPTIASLHRGGGKKELQRVVTKSARVVLLVSLPVALFLVALRRPLLAIFGPEFVPGETAVSILGAGQIVNAAAGSVSLLLIMTGHERCAAQGLAISALLNIGLNAILVPRWGVEGAATATAVSFLVWNVILAVYVHRRLGIHPTALGRIASGTRE